MTNSRIKYPRTPHLPWSPGATSDDIHNLDVSCFNGKKIVVTEKMDGENTTLYCDYLHPRAIDSRPHPSRNWVKALQARLAPSIPLHWRICGENVYARHSIGYSGLESYFYVFSIWNEHNICLDWETTFEWITLLELNHPKILYQGIWDESYVRSITVDESTMEGYVVRVADPFPYHAFSKNCAKWVRQDHVQSESHWMQQVLVPNELKSKE